MTPDAYLDMRIYKYKTRNFDLYLDGQIIYFIL